MRNKAIVSVMALVLCMGVFFMPVTAYAASDTTKPTCDAWLSGDTLHIEASDDGSGVDAVYVDGQRINYLVNGAVAVLLKDYAGAGETVSVYAVDFAGNQSDTVEIRNPYYVQPASADSTDAASSTSASSSGSSGGGSTSTSTASSGTTGQSASSSTASSGSVQAAESESAVPDGDGNPLTPEGQATVTDNATEDEGKEFFTFSTPEGNVFYLIVDRQRADNNVYFLNAVTETDLLALAESDGGATGESAIPDATTATAETTPDPDPEPEADPEPETETGGGMSAIILMLVAVAAVGVAGYYFKIVRPKQQAALDDTDDDFEDDEYGEDYGDGLLDSGADEYLPDDLDGSDDLEYSGEDMEDNPDEEE